MGRQPAHLENLKATYCYIEAYIAEHRIPPPSYEIGSVFGLTTDAVRYRLKVMVTLGWIVRDGRRQSIVLKGMR